MNKTIPLTILLMSIFCNCKRVEVPVIEGFDTNRYLGTWYEIARLDHRFERGLEQTTANYGLKSNGRIGVTNRGFSPAKGEWHEAGAEAVATKVKNYFKVYFVPIFYGKYRVAYIDPDYTVAVVSGGSTRYLWFLSRTPSISPEQHRTMLEVAHRMGYDTSKLIYPKQK